MESFDALAAALGVGVVGALLAMIRRKALRDAERNAWRTASLALGLAPRCSAFAHLGVAETMEGTFDGMQVVVVREVDETTGVGELTVRSRLEPPLRLGLRLRSHPEGKHEDAMAAPPLDATGLALSVVQAHDGERARRLLQKLRRKLELVSSKYDLHVDDHVVSLTSRKVGRAEELRADLETLVTFRRALEEARRHLGESSTDAAIRASWEALAEGKDVTVSPGPVLRGTLRKLPLEVTLDFHAIGGTHTTEIVLTCPLPPAACFRAMPNFNPAMQALMARLVGGAPERAAVSPRSIMGPFEQILGQRFDLRPASAFEARFAVTGTGAPTEAVRSAMLRLDPCIGSLTGTADGLALTATSSLEGDDLARVVAQAEDVAFTMMGQTPGDGVYREDRP